MQGEIRELPASGHGFPSLGVMDTVGASPEIPAVGGRALYLCALVTVALWEGGGDTHSLPTLSQLPEPCRVRGAEPRAPITSAIARKCPVWFVEL